MTNEIESCVVVMTTCEDQAQADAITQAVIEQKLTACVQQQLIKSCYWWEDRIQSGSEIQLQIKTKATLFNRLEKVITELHSYDIPEIIATPIIEGHRPYLKWISDVTI